ncbi:MAG: methyltransferase [Woeseiaceae bacterium]
MRYALSDLRNRWLSQPTFRAFFGKIWPFRLIARRRARQLFDLSAGFVYSKVLMSCVELDWFERLRTGPVALDQLAIESKLPVAAADRLAKAAVTLGLLEKRPSSMIALGPLGAAMIGDQGIAAMAAHHRLFYEDMRAPLALLRGDIDSGLSQYWGYATSDDPASLSKGRVAEYSALMAASQPMIVEQVLASMKFDQFRHVMDVGGGTGAFLRAIGSAYPSLERTLVDLPGVVAGVGPESGLNIVGGSFLDVELPAEPDLVTLVRIIHDHDDHTVLALLKNIRQRIRPEATLMIAEPLAATKGAETVGDAYFGFYLLAMGSGRARTPKEINELLLASGFSPVQERRTPVPLICSVLLSNPV